MECPLIDFSSPEQNRESTLLIPECMIGSAPVSNNCLPYSMSEEENNPFDLVECQVAANAAAENDPFEMVLNDAINHKQSPRMDRHEQENEVEIASFKMAKLSIGKKCDESDHSFLNLDDIPPPDSLLSSSMDDSYLLDETLLPSIQHSMLNVSELHQVSCTAVALENQKIGEEASFRSDEELKLSAQRMIKDIISKAELKAKFHNQDTLPEMSQSDHPLCDDFEKKCLNSSLVKLSHVSKPQEASSLNGLSPITMSPGFVNFTGSQSNESLKKVFSLENISKNCDQNVSRGLLEQINQYEEQGKPDISPARFLSHDFSTHFEEWSQNEMNKLNLSLDEFSVFNNSPGTEVVNLYSSQKVERRRSRSSGPELVKGPRATPPRTSPVLLTIPLCEDAVKNLNLCSKFSPDLDRAAKNYTISKKDEKSSSTTAPNLKGRKLETKLILRKTTCQKKQSKLAPMKATAPVQNMTRSKSSASPISSTRKLVGNIISVNDAEKSLLKEEANKSSRSTSNRLSIKMPLSIHQPVGSLKNLPVKGNKLPTRLPSPQRPTAAPNEAIYLKKRCSSICSSPKIDQRSSPSLKSGSNVRALSDVNMCPSTWRSPKRRVGQLELPRRSRSLLTEKENLHAQLP